MPPYLLAPGPVRLSHGLVEDHIVDTVKYAQEELPHTRRLHLQRVVLAAKASIGVFGSRKGLLGVVRSKPVECFLKRPLGMLSVATEVGGQSLHFRPVRSEVGLAHRIVDRDLKAEATDLGALRTMAVFVAKIKGEESRAPKNEWALHGAALEARS